MNCMRFFVAVTCTALVFGYAYGEVGKLDTSFTLSGEALPKRGSGVSVEVQAGELKLTAHDEFIAPCGPGCTLDELRSAAFLKVLATIAHYMQEKTAKDAGEGFVIANGKKVTGRLVSVSKAKHSFGNVKIISLRTDLLEDSRKTDNQPQRWHAEKMVAYGKKEAKLVWVSRVERGGETADFSIQLLNDLTSDKLIKTVDDGLEPGKIQLVVVSERVDFTGLDMNAAGPLIELGKADKRAAAEKLLSLKDGTCVYRMLVRIRSGKSGK